MEKSNVLLEAKNVTKSFSGVKALRNGCLTLYKGRVHALCGGNGAGKSTFLNVLMGKHRMDGGGITLEGRTIDFASPSEALEAGISMISQELEPIPDMTIAENIFLGRESRVFKCIVDYGDINKRCSELLASLNLDLEPQTCMRDLSLAQIQLVEIAKAVSYDSVVIIMDEPTSAIGEEETWLLFDIIGDLKSKGVAVVYVSHRMNELYDIADDYSVFRDGEFIKTGEMKSIDKKTLVADILGTTLEDEYSKNNTPGDEVLLAVTNATIANKFSDISIELRKGEVLGIFGLMGSGRSEFLEGVYGVEKFDTGAIYLESKKVDINKPKDAINNGIALLTEDRKRSGLCLESSVLHNISLSSLESTSRFGLVDQKKELDAAMTLVDQFSIKTDSVHTPVKYLSGGNQQKIVLAKCSQTNPSIFLMDEPTRGVDVGAKRDIYQFISSFAESGKGVIVVSSEIPEIIGTCDRVVVFKRGLIAGQLANEEITQENLAVLAS